MTPSRTKVSSMQTHAFAALLFLAVAPSAHAAATISLKAVAKNGVAINPPTNSLNVAPGDTVTAEVLLFGWNNPPFDGGSALIQTFQVALLGREGIMSSGNCPGDCNSGYVLPLGWDAPLDRDPCPCDDPCYPICNVAYGCVGPNLHPEQMASIDRSRQDFIFRGFDSICGVDLSSPDIRWGCTVNGSDGQTASRCSGGPNAGGSCSIGADCPGGICDANFQSYLGTLNLKAGSNVCGTFTFTFDSNLNNTFIANPAVSPVTVTPIIQGLTLVVVSVICAPPTGACCNDATAICQEVPLAMCGYRTGELCSTCQSLDPPCGEATGACCVASTCTDGVTQANCLGNQGRWGGTFSTCATMDPPCIIDNIPISTWTPNCAIDARRPFPPGEPAIREGWNAWTWTFQSPLGAGEDSPNDFTLRQVPSTTPPTPPTIASITSGAGNTVALHFSAPIQPNRWTCVKHLASGVEKCLGYLPGDVDNSRISAPADILKIIDNLNSLVNPPLQAYRCDIDRSGACTPADILTEIDLLNGVTGYPVQNGKSLEPCPTP